MRGPLATPWRKYVNVQHSATELYGLDATAPAGSRLRIVIVPGNPGNARYYERFMQALHHKFDGSADIVAISHLGHDPDSPYKGKVWNLKDQIRHKADFLQQHVLGDSQKPVVVLAHSIGVYIMAHALSLLPSATAYTGDTGAPKLPSQLLKFCGLFPFLAVDRDSQRQKMIKGLAATSGFTGSLAGGLSVLPFFVKSALVSTFSRDMEPHAVDTTVHLLTRNSVRNNLYMAHHEFKDLDKAPDWPIMRTFGSRFTLVCCPKDVWAPRHHYEEALQELPEAQVIWREGVNHAFCVSSRECEDVAAMVHGMVEPLLLDYEAGGRPPKQAPGASPGRLTSRL